MRNVRGCFFLFLVFNPWTFAALSIRNIVWLGITKRTLNVIRKFLFYHVFNRSVKKGKYRKSKNNFISHSFKILKLMLWVALSLVHFTQFSKEMKILSFASGRNILFLMILHFRRKRIKKMLLQSLIWCLTLTLYGSICSVVPIMYSRKRQLESWPRYTSANYQYTCVDSKSACFSGNYTQC